MNFSINLLWFWFWFWSLTNWGQEAHVAILHIAITCAQWQGSLDGFIFFPVQGSSPGHTGLHYLLQTAVQPLTSSEPNYWIFWAHHMSPSWAENCTMMECWPSSGTSKRSRDRKSLLLGLLLNVTCKRPGRHYQKLTNDGGSWPLGWLVALCFSTNRATREHLMRYIMGATCDCLMVSSFGYN